MATEIIHLDCLVCICGYFYSDCSNINNGYNCSHPDSDKEIVNRYNDIIDIQDEIVKYFCKGKVKFKRRVRKKKIKQIKQALHNEGLWVKKLGFRYVGSCHSFSCPVSCEADLEDMRKFDITLYNEYKNDEFGPTESGANYMLV